MTGMNFSPPNAITYFDEKKKNKGQGSMQQIEMYCLILMAFLVTYENWCTSFLLIMLSIVIHCYYFFPESIINTVMSQPNEWSITNIKMCLL